jgi:DNA-binding transcriptional MerR regulator
MYGRKIGDAAKNTGLSVKTIRFYCDKGLINPAGRTEGKYRLFDETSELELKLVRSLRSLDMPVDEVRAFMEARRSGECSCEQLQARMREKKQEISRNVDELMLLQDAIDDMLINWEECGGVKNS